MITVITELGDQIILSPALVAQGDAAVEAYVAEQRTKVLKLPAMPLHAENDKAKIAQLIAKRKEGPILIAPPVDEETPVVDPAPGVGEE